MTNIVHQPVSLSIIQLTVNHVQ